MIDLSKYILESVFDEPSDAKLNKLAISKIKAWVKTIRKDGKGRVKFDQENMKVILPSQASFNIFCPIPNSITLEIDGDDSKYRLSLTNATDDDIDKVKHLPMRTKHLYDSYITRIPQEWSFIDSNIGIYDPNNNIDLSNLSEVTDISIESTKKVKIFGIENIKAARYIQFKNITVDGIFKKLKETSMDMDHVDCDVNLFKNVNNIINKYGISNGHLSIEFKNCLVDLSNITKYEGYITLGDLSDLKGEFLPKYIDTLKILDENIRVEDLSNINLSNVNTLIVDCLGYINPLITKDKEALSAYINLYQAVEDRIERVPQEIIDYFVKNTKRIKYNDVKNNEEYFVIPHDWIRKSEYISMYKIKGSVIIDEVTNAFHPFNTCSAYYHFGYDLGFDKWERGRGCDTDLVNTFVRGEDAYIFKINDKVKPLADSIMKF